MDPEPEKVMDIQPVKIEQDYEEIKTEQNKVVSIQRNKLDKNVKSRFKKNPDDFFKCEDCWRNAKKNNYFQTKGILNRHIQRCHSSTKYTCEICFKLFQDPCSVTRHMRSVHLAADKIGCSVCQKIYFNRSSLTKHMFMVHKLKTGKLNYSKCELCSKEFACTADLEAHVVEKHVVDKEFECPVCSKKCIDPQSVDYHIMRAHKSVRTNICDICAAEFSLTTSLNHHVKQVHSRFTFCSKCKKSFMNELEFNQHLKTIPDENTADDRAFKCQICNLMCTSQCNFDWHLNSHITKLKSVQKTEQEDEKEEAFKCDLCFKIFDRETHLEKHQKNIHQICKWKCSFKNCFKSFGSSNLLNRHKFYYHGTKKYKCTFCHKPFDCTQNLESHIRLKHPDSKGLLTALNVFICKLNECSFKTREEKYLATHYQEEHGLPIVRLDILS